MENIKTTPREFFLHLLSNVALYYCAGWLVALYYSYVDYSFGTVNQFTYDTAWLPGQMRWAIASLVIVFPVYILVTRFLNKDLDAHPEKRELRIRKWLMYLALSLASVALVIDLVALIYQFLSGEFATAFFLKVLSVAIVSGLVFAYYFYELRREHGKPAPQRIVFRIIALILVAISVIGGFFVVGSPTQARMRQYDLRRINDLQGIQWQVVNYWQSKAGIPTTLDSLQDPISGYVLPIDPESQTGKNYEYKSTGVRSFELCATFSLDGGNTPEIYGQTAPMPVKPIGVSQDSWQHGAGRVCFDRTIDPDLYPVRPLK